MYMSYDYQTPPMSPRGEHSYYSPRYTAHTTPPPRKTHTRRATQDATYTTYPSPRVSTYYTTYTSPSAMPSARAPDYVSPAHLKRSKPRSSRPDTHDDDYERPQRHRSSTYTTYVYPTTSTPLYSSHYEEYLAPYDRHHRTSPPPPYEGEADAGARTRTYVYRDVDADADFRASKSRPSPSQRRRAASTTNPSPHHNRTSNTSSSKPSHHPSPPKPRPAAGRAHAHPQATPADAARAHIPAGYSLAHWDPSEEPIFLLGSVFDANSLGKWIYDWSVASFGPATPLTEIAGEVWLVLIQLAGKVRRCEEWLDDCERVRSGSGRRRGKGKSSSSRGRRSGGGGYGDEEDRDTVEEFLAAGQRLWDRFAKLVKVCEGYMWAAAKRDDPDAEAVSMGATSGTVFVDAMFGRDAELARSEKWMARVRLWGFRFDAAVDEILRG